MSMVAEVKQLVQKPVLAENLEMAAQLLEDSCGDVMKFFLKGMLEMKAETDQHQEQVWRPTSAPNACFPSSKPEATSSWMTGLAADQVS